ncbi:MAG: 4-(cytidine 5'-diphospho)-2-C-methyl-D-erythritol kinase [Muribaculaceae bacterium]|nr:4-(cytidine 5'-diphospho)-2-C-methyl-D-erythritol kinase [Muribaculaceae bacterium]
MIKFVNAKINIGLQIVGRRQDGYHNLQTLFYPVGLYAGSSSNPEVFCDILEVIPSSGMDFTLKMLGNQVDCPMEKNLVWRAADIFFSNGVPEGFGASLILDKHLPDGAGLGGGSADAAFTLLALREEARNYADRQRKSWQPPTDRQLMALALKLGADCPFFIYNRAAYAEGVGELLKPVDLDLHGYFLVVVKPFVSVSTREAFAGVRPAPSSFDLRCLPEIPVSQWRDCVFNDFEKSIFPAFPAIRDIKAGLYDCGAEYASLTGSGACVYGIYRDRDVALEAMSVLRMVPTIKAVKLLQL